ncbi:TPA: MobB relaxase/mobilization protein, partial [Escherichia coli]|nr:MobB relaxase/mobilization protein [Escherichia coli]
MLIRVRGGDAGIKEYLENGQKDGRDYSRDELDERVILSGDLELTDAVINNMDKTGERYLHITLAFKEDEISREKLQEITDEFKKFAMTAYEGDEYNFYAEAHLPKLKT